MTLLIVNSPDQCADTAATVLERYCGNSAIQAAFTNLLTDLAHLALREGWAWEIEARAALRNATNERGLAKPREQTQ